MIRKFAAAVLTGVLMASSAGASALDDALTAFASDISNGDKEFMVQVAGIIATPPTTVEEIGFYGAEDASPEERQFRAVIFRLSEAGHIFGFEDKYINEMAWVLKDRGWIADAEAVVEYTQALGETYGSDMPEAEIAKLMQEGFGPHVDALEKAAEEAGRALLFIDVPVGDTFHLASVSKDLADKWRNVVFVQTEYHAFAVTDPQWETYYDFLGYAIDLRSTLDYPRPFFDSSKLRSLAEAGFDP